MSVVAAAVIGSAVVGAGTAYFSGEKQEESTRKAAESQEKISDANIALQQELANQQREDFAPWRDVGEQALNKIWEGVQSGEFTPEKFDPSKINLEQDPGYRFRVEQGVEALDKSAAARGRLLSGAQQKALTQYGQDVGSQEYSNAYSRYADQYAREADRRARKFNILSGLSGQGQSSAARQAGATSQLAQQSGNILSNLGQSQQQAAYASGQARAGAYQGMGQAANQAAQNWLLYKNLGGGAA